ncbi:WXG100 family type VII secretion target [Streptomyces sp. NPDC059851]|uniref:WXG100 family type VII secretion target n=1 Tax=Streptomyces sp. NPDC059851 TaxID=3346971 RepID=UPI003666FE87
MATNFEGFTHQQLLAMVASIDSETVKSRATQLTTATTTIREIGNALKTTKVTGWEGTAAQAFANWADQAGSATLRLADLSEAGGKWMTEAAQIMVEVKKNIPPYDQSAADNLKASKDYRNDPDAQQMGREAWSKLSGDHQKAVDALTKLAGAYEQSATQIGKVEIPTFPPPPGPFQPKGVDGSQDVGRPGGGYGGTSGSAGVAYTPASPPGSGPYSDSGDSGGGLGRPDINRPPTTGPAPVVPDRDVDVDLDNVAVLPDKTVPPVTTPPNIPSPGPGGPTPVGPVPPVAFPPLGGGPTLPGGGGPVSKLPPVPSPPASGGKIGGVPPLPRDTGIVGGRQVTVGGPTPGIPRGTVIGTEGPMGGGRTGGGVGGMHPGMGGPQVGGPGGSATGRRLAMEPGGVVAGRQPGMIGRTPIGGQPFTQGGAGLVRKEAGIGSARGPVGHLGAGVHASGNRRDQQTGERPDYLSEDDETWRSNGRVVPPVID